MQQLSLLFLLSLGHLVTDMTGGAIPVLLPVIKSEFSLSYTAIGVIILVSNLISSVIQPFFGIWSDRKAILWLLPAGCLLAGVGLALVGLAPGYLLILLAVAVNGIGAAAYHPEASKQSFLISGEKKATALSIYSVGGNIGHGLGPIMAALLLDLGGRRGVGIFLIISVITAILLKSSLPAIKQLANKNTHDAEKDLGANPADGGMRKGVILALFLVVMIVILRSLVHLGMTNFIPLYVEEYLKGSKHFGALLLTVFLLSGAVGTIFGGLAADRIGRKRVMVLSFALVTPLLWLLLISNGIWAVVFAALSGFVLISTFSVTVVYAQELIPNRVGLASGLILGFAFGVGALGGLAFGAAADLWGVPAVLKAISLLPIPAFFLSLWLPQEGRSEKSLAGTH
ncbi:MAG TPA: MFS transporter [Syntrophomonadaceae bacterium]|nr:MFS transporter [Syntrophomonadaceae bacterium]